MKAFKTINLMGLSEDYNASQPCLNSIKKKEQFTDNNNFLKCFFIYKYIKIIIFLFLKIIFNMNILK